MLASLLLAGCAGEHAHDDGHHGGPGAGTMESGVIVGVENKGERQYTATANVTDANGTLLWTETFTVGPNANPEKHHALNATGPFTLIVTWTWTDNDEPRHNGGREEIDPARCGGLSHITFIVATDGSLDGTHEECHE